ncbi:MAG: adenylate/guanylate cyclase domain-containing protein [Nitrososphaeraceae archaeon]
MVERWVSFINLPLLQQARARITKTLLNGIELDMSTEECKKMLRRHVNTKSNLVTMFVDINHSTEMSLSLPENKFALMLQSFAQEISIALAGYGGYVFKYEGDAVIALFPAEYDNVKACRNALDCSKAILDIINEVINPAFKTNQLPEITVKIGLAYGYALVVLYGKSLEKAHIDIVGSSISLSAKISSIAKANQILLGESIYNILKTSPAVSSCFREVNLDPTKWKYLSHSDPESLYHVYEYINSL